MKRIIVQEAVLNTNVDYLPQIKENMRKELIKAIDALEYDDFIMTEDRENCKYLKIVCKFD